jgi:proteasome lid subunit RPN8/RPN11
VIHLSEELEQAIRDHAVADYPYECCGVLLGEVENGVKVATEIRRIENTHEDGHERRFRIAPEVLFQLDREERAGGPKVLGFYHSHPDHPARPSQYDRDHAAGWYSYIIVASRNGGTEHMTSWVAVDDTPSFRAERIQPWEGRREDDYRAVFADLNEDDRGRCLPLESVTGDLNPR